MGLLMARLIDAKNQNPKANSEETPQIHLVTGKGGVGKSTIAAALAMKLAEQGQRTLLVELGETSYLSQVFERKPSFGPQEILPHLELSLWTGEGCLKELVRHYIPLPPLVDMFFKSPVMLSLIQAAPALKELAILGKATSHIRHYGPELPYESVVIDAYATGHFRALLRAPKGMAEAVKFGPMGEQSRKIRDVVSDSKFTSVYIATLPEELPTEEAVELYRDLKSEFGIEAKVFLNRFLEGELDPEVSDPLVLAELNRNPRMQVFGEFLRVLSARQKAAQKKLNGEGVPFAKVPWVLEPSARARLNKIAAWLRHG